MRIRKMINQGKGFDLSTNSLNQFVKEYVEISQEKFACEHLNSYAGYQSSYTEWPNSCI